MIHAYHVIFGTYGFWLPNDPRGSWSDFVHSWELAQFGAASKAIPQEPVDFENWIRWRAAARESLKYPTVTLTGHQALAVGNGFSNAVRKSSLTVWACSIMPEHIHLVVARHKFSIEQITNLLKGEATKSLKAKSLHPLVQFADDRGKVPSIWASGEWKVYLDSEAAIEAAIQYVEENPIKENMPRQTWSFVTPFAGISRSGRTTYH